MDCEVSIYVNELLHTEAMKQSLVCLLLHFSPVLCASCEKPKALGSDF